MSSGLGSRNPAQIKDPMSSMGKMELFLKRNGVWCCLQCLSLLAGLIADPFIGLR